MNEKELVEEKVRKFFFARDVNGTPIGEFILHNGEMLADIAEIQDTLRTILIEVQTSAEQLGYEQGFVKGQKHAFGVDRKAVEQEGYARGMGEARGVLNELHKEKYGHVTREVRDTDQFYTDAWHMLDAREAAFFTPTDNNKEV